MEVNKIIYIVLAFFLGFGVHKFYAGKTMSGFLHLAFSGQEFHTLSQLLVAF